MEPTVADEARNADAKRLATICYALYAASCLVGLTAIAAIIINYLKRDDVACTWVASHFEGQIKTFWYGLAGAFVSWPPMVVLICVPLLRAVGVLVIDRLVQVWLPIAGGKPVDASQLV